MKNCPICFKEYFDFPNKCDCGFCFDKPNMTNEERQFKIFKYAKNIYFDNIKYPKAILRLACGDYCYIEDIISEKRGVEYISYHKEEQKTCLAEGVLASRGDVKALIIDTDVLDSMCLDESQIETLIIGKNVYKIINELLKSPNTLRYIYVDNKNINYISYENVLINNRTREIVCYPNGKKDKIYYVPQIVKKINYNPFADNKNLCEIYIPKNTKIGKNIDFNNLKIVFY